VTAAAPARLADLPAARPLAWGARVSPAFRAKVRQMVAGWGGCTADELMTCMAWESARSFRPDVRNMAGSGAIGLIQFMPATAAGLGTTTTALARMTAEAQLDYVAKYFKPYRGRLAGLADLYMAILWPVAVGKPDDYVLFDKADLRRPALYRQNAGLDVDRDGRVTKREAAAKVAALLPEGLRPVNLA
jgi:hypothetical protein